MVTWAEAGVGAVATQSIPDVAYGPKGLELMGAGTPASDALATLVAKDPMEMVRQVAMVDATGGVATHTGAGCVAQAGHVAGDQVSVQANMMEKPTVWPAMLDAYRGASGDLAAPPACRAGGGRGRGRRRAGKQSAAILVVAGERTDAPWDHKLFDLRVDDSPEPLTELRRLIDYNRAFDLQAGVLFGGLLFAPEIDPAGAELAGAIAALDQAQAIIDPNREPTFWSVVLLAKAGRVDEARERLARACQTNERWSQFLGSLPAAGVLPADTDLLARLQA